MSYCTNVNEKYIFQQGDQVSSSFFIIDKGECGVVIDGVEKKRLGPGDSFGEKALLYNAPRSASITAEPHSKFWTIDRKTFVIVIAEITQRYYSENRAFIDKVLFFGMPPNYFSWVYQDNRPANFQPKGLDCPAPDC
jgi:signal-transduction protein with cAMP-binding, CBS, and nucleotidyltransferase domain